MSDKAIRAALETRLSAIGSPLATAWENLEFEPTPGVPYQRVSILRAEPENPELSGTLVRLSGFMQVTLFYPQADGPGAAEAKAEAIRAHFPRKLTLSSGGVSVVIDPTPYVMQGFADGDRWAVPVRVPYFSNIS